MEVEESNIVLFGYDSVTDEWYPLQVTINGDVITV